MAPLTRWPAQNVEEVKILRNVAKETSAGKLPKRNDRFTVASVA